MNWKTKVLVVASVVALITVLVLILKHQQDTIDRLSAIEKSVVESKTLADGTVRSESAFVTQDDFDAFVKANDINVEYIKDDLEKLDANIRGISTVKVVSKEVVGVNVASTKTTPNPNPVEDNTDKYGYLNNRQVLKINEEISEEKIPIGEVGFSAWQELPWDYTIKSREYSVVNVLGQDEDGRHYVYNKFFIDVDGKKYKIDIAKSEFKETMPDSEFRFATRLYAGFDGGAYLTEPSAVFYPSLRLSLFNYGMTNTDPDWVFASIGAGFDFVQNRFLFSLNPVSYNVGHNLPLVNNIFVGPAVSSTLNGDVALTLGIGFGL